MIKPWTKPRFEWWLWAAIVAGSTTGNLLAGVLSRQVTDLYSGLVTVVLAAGISATLGGLLVGL